MGLHNPDKADYLKKLGADELMKFDYTDPATWGPALKDVEVVYSASLDPLLEHHLKFCDFLGTNRDQIKHVVRISHGCRHQHRVLQQRLACVSQGSTDSFDASALLVGRRGFDQK